MIARHRWPLEEAPYLNLVSERIVSSAEFSDPVLQRHVSRMLPQLRSQGLAANPYLELELWKELYTFTPKVALPTALLLTDHPLSSDQIEHLLTGEKRVSVWECVLRSTVVSRATITHLGRRNLLSRNAQETSPWYNPQSRVAHPSPYSLRNVMASERGVGLLWDESRGPAVNWLIDQLQGDTHAWEMLLSLVDAHGGTLQELVETVGHLRCE